MASYPCRFCSISLDTDHRYALFSKLNREKKLPDRFSSLVGLPVKENDGLSLYYCRKCLRKLINVETVTEEMRSHARSSYSRAGYKPCSVITSSPKARDTSRKRVKDTSGHGASPHTTQARPLAKRVSSRRLIYSTTEEIGSSHNIIHHSSHDPHTADVSTEELPTASTNICSDNITSSILADYSPVPKNGSIVEETSFDGVDIDSRPRNMVMLTVSSPSRVCPFTSQLDNSLQRIGRTLAGGDPRSIAKAVLSEEATRQHIVDRFVQEIDSECASVCRRQPVSVFRKITPKQMEIFSWDEFITELRTKCPILYQILETIVSHSDHRNKSKKGTAHHPGICLAAAVLLKERNREMVSIQSLISLVLFNSRVPKKVYVRLNHLGMCISYPATITLVCDISKRHKEPLGHWIENGDNFKFVGDNVAKTKGVRDIRSDHRSHLVHMYSMLVVKSRVTHPVTPPDFVPPRVISLKIDQCLPTEDDIKIIKANLLILVSRTLCKYIKCLKKLKGNVPSHIVHKYSNEMRKKSEVVVLDVLHKNETKGADMIDIMQEMHGYLGDNSTIRLSGGDYVTVERQRCSKQHMMDSDTQRGRLGLLEPCAEDWHCLMNILMNTWKCLFSKSSKDHGTMTHLLTQLRRLPEAKVPKDNMHACQDALLTIYNGHIVAKACQVLNISSPDDSPAKSTVIDLKQLAMTIVDSCTIVSDAILGHTIQESGDGKYNYARVLCHYTALVTEFLDAWSEGDGQRVLRCWKIFLMHFYSDKRTKYACEALRVVFQLASLPPHLVSQITWDRFVNTHGGDGRNIPCDLHNEHINCLFKEIVGNMGSNFTQEASTKAARSVSSLAKIAYQFDQQTNIHPQSVAHTRKSDDEDLKLVVKVLIDSKCLQIIENRHHSNFPEMRLNLLHKFKRDEFDVWVQSKKKQYDKFNHHGTAHTSNFEDCDED